MPTRAPDSLLEDLDPEQRAAVLAVRGPVVILAGAGSGKTRVISRRTAYAIATGVVDPDQVLVVTFTDKAAGEMGERLRLLGLPGVTARTFHAHALSQLRHFWPSRHDGADLPNLLDSKLPIVAPLARHLPGNYKFRPAKDIADEIEWAKVRRVSPSEYEREAAAAHREPPIPGDLLAKVFDQYERLKAKTQRLDFEDLLLETVRLLETDAEAAETVRARKSWFSVDEYQDTNPLQERLLELWLGERDDLCVVGDEDQTIYSFTGASSDYLRSFAARWSGAQELSLVRNYRSSPQVLALSNRLIAAEGRTKQLVAMRPDGPDPVIAKHATGVAELAALCTWITLRLADGTRASEIAVLVRMNAQLPPIEEALTRAGIAYLVRGLRFYARPEVRTAVLALRKLAGSDAPEASLLGPALAGRVRAIWHEALGFDEAAEDEESGSGQEARERQASLETLLAIVEGLAAGDGSLTASGLLAALDARAVHEREGAADGVNLLTLHRAKGLEWDAVALLSLEEGILPIRQASDDAEAIAEERRLLYVGMTRAREHLLLSWALQRDQRGHISRREASRFLLDLRPPRSSRVTILPGSPMHPAAERAPRPGASGDPLFEALRVWRTEQARIEAVPAYVVAPDKTLTEIAERRPRTISALRRIPGIGPAKLERYGDDILAIVERSLTS
jgi:DNA helicase-2/ATP-dependent DNA helicase PcrA